MSTLTPSDETVFAGALERPATERAAFLDEACAGDPERRARIESLLRANESAATKFLATATTPPRIIEPASGEMIGRYKILQKLGEGGCGTVYMAEQEVPVRRRVALKVIKLGMDTKEVIARFEAERQALALMDHQNIARVFDAGATDAGRPFFVMELVRGVKVTEYCDQHNLSTNARLELFMQICHAVQHAHQKGIIHRDLKPSNILITLHDGKPVPKVIDFGIAKATIGRLTDATLFTAFEQFIGTPAYMSPEQAELSGLDIDTRSDIYSLGVLLYELLTGRTPFDAKSLLSAGLDEIRRIIREVDPPRPSTRLNTLTDGDRTTIAKQRGLAPTQLSTLLRGDLDWIVMRCLEKDRTRRYETANSLALDVLRHLHDEVVVARPPTAVYIVRKSIRRHRFGYAAALAIFGVITVGGIVSTWQAVRAKRAEREQFRLRETAQSAEANEKTLRIAADAQKLAARQRAYAADMNLVQQSLDIDNIGRAKELLYAHVPTAGDRDLRGWEWRYLWQFCQPEFSQRLCENGQRVWSVSASSDGAWLAAGFFEHDWLLWDVRTGAEFRPQVGNGRHLSFSPREPLLALSELEPATAGALARHAVLLWNVATRQVVERLDHSGPCSALRFSEDGQRLITFASAGAASEVTTWQVHGGKQLDRFRVSPLTPSLAATFAISPRGKLAAQSLNGTQLRLVDLETGKTRWTVTGAEEFVSAIVFSPDEKMLASGSAFTESNIKLWDVATGREIARLDGHRAWVSALVFWPDGKTLASASGDQTIKLWDLATRQCARTLRGHQTEIYRLTLLPDGKTLATGGKDGAVYLWDVQSGKHPSSATSLPEPVWAWGFSPDSQSLVAVTRPGEVAQWSGHGFQDKRALFPLRNLSPNVRPHLRFSADLRSLAIGFPNGTVQVWDVAGRTLGTEVKIGMGSCYPEFFFAENNRLVVFESPSKSYHDIDLRSGSTLASWDGPVRGTRDIMAAMSPDEARSVAFGFIDGKAVLREMASGRVTQMSVAVKELKNPAFSPDGRLIAAASASPGGVVLWETASMRELARFSGFLQGTHSVAFSPDNRRLAAGGTGREALTLWDLESRHRLITLAAPGSMYLSTAFSADGNTLGSSNNVGTLSFWRAPSWQEIAEGERAHAAWVYRPAPAVRQAPASDAKSDESKAGANPVLIGRRAAEIAAPMAPPSASPVTTTNVAIPATSSQPLTGTAAMDVTGDTSRLAVALKTLEIRRQSHGPEDPNTLLAMSNVGVAYYAERRYADAAAIHRETLELRKRVLGAEHPSTLASMSSLGVTLGALGKFTDATGLLTQTVELRKRVSGEENAETLRSMKSLAFVHRSQRKFADAFALTKEVLEIERRTLGADAPTTLATMHDLGGDYLLQGKLPEAATHFIDTLAIADRALGPESPVTVQTMENLSSVLLSLRRYAEAEPLCRRLVEARTKSAFTWRTASARTKLGDALRGLQRFSEAEPLLVENFEQLARDHSSIPAANRSVIRSAGIALVQLYTDWNQPEKAAVWKQKVDNISPAPPPPKAK